MGLPDASRWGDRQWGCIAPRTGRKMARESFDRLAHL